METEKKNEKKNENQGLSPLSDPASGGSDDAGAGSGGRGRRGGCWCYL